MSDMFECNAWGLRMDPAKQPGFCSRRHSQAVSDGDSANWCYECQTGKDASQGGQVAICKHICDKCGKEFHGGPTAKTCQECKGKASGEGNQKSRKAAKKKDTTASKYFTRKSAKPKSESVQVLDILVRFGIVTQEQIEAARVLADVK